MRTPRPSLSRSASSTLLVLLLLAWRLPAKAQTTDFAPATADRAAERRVQQARITQAIDEKNLVVLHGSQHPLARPEFDRGIVADAQPLNRMLLLLQRSPDQEARLAQFLDDQHNKFSPNYHRWLTPDQFGKQYGVADSDIQAVTDWLLSQGFTQLKVSPGRTTIEFSGNVARVRNALHTEMHHFVVNGRAHIANANDPQIPAALTPVVAGVVSLNNFPVRPHVHPLGVFQKSSTTGETKPLFTFPGRVAKRFSKFLITDDRSARVRRGAAPFDVKGAVFDVAVSASLQAEFLPSLAHQFGSTQFLPFRNATNCSTPNPSDGGRASAPPDSYACSPISPSLSSRSTH